MEGFKHLIMRRSDPTSEKVAVFRNSKEGWRAERILHTSESVHFCMGRDEITVVSSHLQINVCPYAGTIPTWLSQIPFRIE